MTSKYQKGRHDALETLGLRPKAKDNPLVSNFVAALEEDGEPESRKEDKGNRPLHRQSWGKAVEYSTSNQIFNGGGTRL